MGRNCRTLKVSPPPKSQSSKNRCRHLCGGCLQPQKGVAPPCLTETPTTSNQPSSGNFGVKRGLGCWRGRKRFGMEGCPMKHRRSIQSSPGVLLWANDFLLGRYKVRHPVSTNAYKAVLDRSYRMRARNPGGQTLLGLFLENAPGTHSGPTSSVMVVVAWRRPAQRHFQFPRER